MVTNGQNDTTLGIDRTKLRLAVLGVLVMVAFAALFSRLWFLQVLASQEYRVLAKENRVRTVHSEPPRGRILDRNGEVIVENRMSLAVTVDRQIVDTTREKRRTLKKLSRLLDAPKSELRRELEDATVSPYKPVAVARDISEKRASVIWENRENFPGVDVIRLPVRKYPFKTLAAQTLGYLGEIDRRGLKSEHFKDAKPAYQPGDVVGRAGLEFTYDRFLRGKPEIRKVIVNATNNVVGSRLVRSEETGKDLVLTLDANIQKAAEKALINGIQAARQLYEAPSGGVVVMDPNNGEVLATASYPTYDANMLADGFSQKEFDLLARNPDTPSDDALLNRPTQGAFPPGSTFKAVTAGAALWSGVGWPGRYIDCDPVKVYGNIPFRNWTSADFGPISFPRSLEISCDTFYYQLAWEMESRYGAALGDGTEKFQDYMRMTGFGHETGIDIPGEADGIVPDRRWCRQGQREISPDWCYGADWLPGYSVNMSIGQGDLTVTPLQMAVAFAAIANDGRVVRPHLGLALRKVDDDTNTEKMVREFEPKTVRRLPLDDAELSVIQEGLEDVISGSSGTARSAFAGFPLDRYPLAGKTGTAQIGSVDSGKNYAWFISYGPTPSPEYVIAAYIDRAGHGGESAAPVAREIWEAIFGIDKETEVTLGQDSSG